jgi:superfamily II DNA/RNA helicase
MTTTFTDLGLPASRVAQLEQQGITAPSPVQAQAVPALLAGKDLLMQSQTGTGKTLAYLLPALERIDPEKAGVQVLVLVPTQELGIQVRDVAKKLLEGTGIGVAALIGGANVQRQIESLKKLPKLVVGTPGRVLDLIRQQRLSGLGVRVMVLDEADQLQEHFRDVEAILKATSPSRQTIFCSATMAGPALAWAKKWLKEPVEVRIEAEKALPDTLTHLAFLVDQRDKLPFIRRLVHHYAPGGAIAFVNDDEDLPLFVDKLRHHKVSAAGLFGGIKKLERAATMRDFRAGKLKLLVATELAARGLDLSQVSIVFNFDLPTDAAHYVHRVGRTGRMGKAGTAITLVAPKEAWVLEKFEKALGIRFERPVLREGAIREATEVDLKREAAKAKSAEKKAQAKAEVEQAIAEGKPVYRPKKPKTKGPTKRQLEKGKAKKAAKKIATQKRQARLTRQAEGQAPEATPPQA